MAWTAEQWREARRRFGLPDPRGESMARPRWRCPTCQVIYHSRRAVCVGGWPVYDPARPGAYIPDHREVHVVPDPQTADLVIGPCATCQWTTRCAWCTDPPRSTTTREDHHDQL